MKNKNIDKPLTFVGEYVILGLWMWLYTIREEH
jgi:hypothetical protein